MRYLNSTFIRYFGSEFCSLELETAINQKKKIALCYNMSKHTVQSALDWVPDPLKFLLQSEVRLILPKTDRDPNPNPNPNPNPTLTLTLTLGRTLTVSLFPPCSSSNLATDDR